MTGRIAVVAIMLIGLVGGVAMYWLNVYAYYDEVNLTARDIRLHVQATGAPEPIGAENIRAIDAGNSPLRFRACFDTPLTQAALTETYRTYEGAVPLTGPGWFDCYDADAIGAALERGTAIAFLGEKNIHYGVDRVIAVMGDGRAYAWHQLNDCGETDYTGTPVAEACPPPPQNAED